MPCVHLKELYTLCEKHDLKISGSDMVRVVCRQCGEQDVCPTALTDGEEVITMPRQSSQAGRSSDDRNPKSS